MSPPTVRTQLGGSGGKKPWLSRLIPNMIEVGARRKYVLIVWGSTLLGMLGNKLWPLFSTLWTHQNITIRQAFHEGISPAQLIFAAALTLWYACMTESKGEHEGAAADARLKRLLKEGVLKLVMAGAGLIEMVNRIFAGSPPPPPPGIGQ